MFATSALDVSFCFSARTIDLMKNCLIDLPEETTMGVPQLYEILV